MFILVFGILVLLITSLILYDTSETDLMEEDQRCRNCSQCYLSSISLRYMCSCKNQYVDDLNAVCSHWNSANKRKE